MKLEDEIKQKKFKDAYAKLAVNILFTHGWLSNIESDLFKEHDITIPQYNILRILRGQYPNPASINLLKDRMLDKMSDASRLVDRLIKKEYVERKICKFDRRKAEVIITPKGLDVLANMDKLEDQYKVVFSTLSKKEINLLNDLLDKLRG